MNPESELSVFPYLDEQRLGPDPAPVPVDHLDRPAVLAHAGRLADLHAPLRQRVGRPHEVDAPPDVVRGGVPPASALLLARARVVYVLVAELAEGVLAPHLDLLPIDHRSRLYEQDYARGGDEERESDRADCKDAERHDGSEC